MITSSMMVLISTVMMQFGSCAENKLKMGIEEVNKQCPISLGLMVDLSSVSYENNEVIFEYALDETFLNLDKIAANENVIKSSVVVGGRVI